MPQGVQLIIGQIALCQNLQLPPGSVPMRFWIPQLQRKIQDLHPHCEDAEPHYGKNSAPKMTPVVLVEFLPRVAQKLVARQTAYHLFLQQVQSRYLPLSLLQKYVADTDQLLCAIVAALHWL